MALHWQHIKGVYGEEPFYTYIEFASKPTGSNLKKKESIPDLYVNTSNYSDRTKIENEKNATHLGKFIVSDAENQSINVDFSFWNKIDCKNTVNFFRTNKNDENNNNTWVKFIDNTTPTSPIDKFCIYNALKNSTQYTVFKMIQNDGRMAIEESDKDYILDIGNSGITSNRRLTMSGLNQIVCGINQTVIDSTKVEAPYFNATSDRRAKEDLLPFNGKALDIINQIQTFTYRYKDTKQVSYGVMAQDLLDIKINDFSFVENAAATGENGDYMSVRESKLVYLLLEGIKELQIEVNNLRKEVEELKNGK